jgi:hypothetical protein
LSDEEQSVVLVTSVEVNQGTVTAEPSGDLKEVVVLEVEGLWSNAPLPAGTTEVPHVGFNLVLPKTMVGKLIDDLMDTFTLEEVLDRSSLGPKVRFDKETEERVAEVVRLVVEETRDE